MLYLAHAGEEHETASQAISHSLLETWYIALPLFILSVSAIGALTYVLSHKSKSTTYTVMLVVFFVAGVAAYTTSAAISVFSLTAGFVMALLQVLLHLGQPHEKGSQ